jgi:hypothetical protein
MDMPEIQETQIWDVISENDCFTANAGQYVYNIDGFEYRVFTISGNIETLKLSESCKVSYSFRQKFSVLLEYVMKPENLCNITVIRTQKSEIVNKFGGIGGDDPLYENSIESILTPSISKKKDRITAVYLLLRYLISTPYNHCLVCGCIIEQHREVCHREVCLTIQWHRPQFFADPLTTYQKLIKLSIQGANAVHLSPKPVEFTEVNDRIAVLYYHLMMYDFEDYEPSPIPEYRCLRNTTPSEFEVDNRVIGYHGSPIGKWVSILRGGLINLSGTEHMSTGAVYGKGVYFSKTVEVASGYAGWNGIIAVCKFPEPVIKDTYYVVPDHTQIYIQYLIFRNLMV